MYPGKQPTFNVVKNVMQTLTWSVAEAKSFDLLAGHVVWINLAETASSLAITNPVTGARVTIFIKQTVGSKLISAWTGFKWAGGVAPTLSTALNSVDCVTAYYDGSNWYADKALNFA